MGKVIFLPIPVKAPSWKSYLFYVTGPELSWEKLSIYWTVVGYLDHGGKNYPIRHVRRVSYLTIPIQHAHRKSCLSN